MIKLLNLHSKYTLLYKHVKKGFNCKQKYLLTSYMVPTYLGTYKLSILTRVVEIIDFPMTTVVVDGNSRMVNKGFLSQDSSFILWKVAGILASHLGLNIPKVQSTRLTQFDRNSNFIYQ